MISPEIPQEIPIHTLHGCFNSPIFRQALQNPSLPTAQLAAAVLLDLPEAPVEGAPLMGTPGHPVMLQQKDI